MRLFMNSTQLISTHINLQHESCHCWHRGGRDQINTTLGPIFPVATQLQTDKQPFGYYLMLTGLINEVVNVDMG